MEKENDVITMSRYAFERMQAKDERNDHWRNVTIIVLIVLLVVTNAMWLYYWNKYEYVEQTDSYEVALDADEGSDANYIGEDGVINNGSTSESNTETNS